MRYDATTGNGKCCRYTKVGVKKTLVKSRWVNLFLAGFSLLEPLFVVAAKQNNKKVLLQSQMDGKRERESEKKFGVIVFLT